MGRGNSLKSYNRKLRGDRDRRSRIKELRFDSEDSGHVQGGRGIGRNSLVDAWTSQNLTRNGVGAESGIRTGKDPSSVSISAATNGRITRRGVGVSTGCEICGSRSRRQTKTDVCVFKTEACRTGAGNAAHHIQLVGNV